MNKPKAPKSIGPYRLADEIGSGGQGRVFRAFRGEGNAPVAIKVLNLSHPKKRARFLQEINIHAALTAAQAPNIMPLLGHDLVETANNGVRGYLVMPLAEASLHDVIETLRGRLELSLELFSGIVKGLKAAHAAGIVHRDVKPGNVLFLNRSLREPLISDFGICLLRETPTADRITDVGETVGAKYFMAPEQEHGGVSEVTFAADVYAAAKLLHFMLTGRYLIRERLDQAFTAEELRQEPRLNVILDELLARCLILEPSERVQNGTELLELSQRVLDGFRTAAVTNGGNGGGDLRRQYDSFTQLLATSSPQIPLAFDNLQESFRSDWTALHEQVREDPGGAPAAAEKLLRSQRSALAMTLAMARLDAVHAFEHFKRFLEYVTAQSEGIAGYPAIAAIAQVEAGFLYMSAAVYALHHGSWSILEKLLSARFEWIYQSTRVSHSFGFCHPSFFRSGALEHDPTRHHDLYRALLMEPDVAEAIRLDKEQTLDTYAKADLLMSLRSAQLEMQGESATRWADFGRFYPERVTPLLDRMYADPEYAAGVLRAFGESREEFLARLNDRLTYIQSSFFGGSRHHDYASLDEWHPR